MGQRKTRDGDQVLGGAGFLALFFQLRVASADVPGAGPGDAGEDHRFPTLVAGFNGPRAGLQLRCLAFRVHDPDLGQGLKLSGKDRHTALKHRLDRLFTCQYAADLGKHLGKPRTLLQFGFVPFSRTEITHHADRVPLVVEPERGDAQLDGKLLAILADRRQFHDSPEPGCLARPLDDRQGSAIVVVKPWGNQAVKERLVQHLLSPVSERPLRCIIPVGDASSVIGHDDRMECRLGDASKLFLRRSDLVGAPGFAM